MLDQLFNIVKQFGQQSVVDNPEIPNEHNQEVLAEATNTIAGGFQNVIAGGGLQNILDLFKKGGNNKTASGGLGGLLKNPIVTMMVGYFISKLVNKFKMNPSSASNIANNLIPGSINDLIEQTNDPNNEKVTMDGVVNSVIGKEQQEEQNDSPLQDLLDKFIGGGDNGSNVNGGFNIQDLIGSFTQKARNNIGNKQQREGGLMDMIQGFLSR
jgi:hypothetical protein